MPLGAAVAAPPRPVSPARSAFHPQNSSPLNPLTRPSSNKPLTRPCASHPHPSIKAATTTSSTQTHLYNLERLLQKQALPPPHDTHGPGGNDGSASGNGLLNALNLSGLFPSSRAAAEEMSPRSLTHLQRVLSDSPRPSPRNTIAPRWRQYHGAGDWAGLLDPLDENLRRELVRYGDLVQATYHAFHSNPDIRPDRSRIVALPDRSYRVTRSLYATASVELPRWVSGVAPWMAQRSSWIGYVAVCDNEREIQRMGRRDIVIALRGTATCLEWAENLRAGLVPMDDGDGGEEEVTKPRHLPKVECGFWNLYKTAGAQLPSLSTAVVEEVRRLMDRYKGEELSITVTGHSLGAALAVLVADELSRCAASVPPVAVFSFGGPRVGNRAFVDRVEGRGVKVLRVVNAHDVVTRVPGVLPAGDGKDGGWPARVLEVLDGYADVGRELRVDSRVSPYLRPNADPACCHDLEAYLHLVDGFLGTHCPFRSNAKRSLARLLSQQGSNVKKLYMSKARAIVVDHSSAVDAAMSTAPTYLASPSS